jgi:hypothetical protein
LPFTIVTDHDALKYFSIKRNLSTRQARWQQILSQFDYKITYRPGKANIVVDALSRKTTDFATVKARQVKDRFAAVADPQNIVEPIEPLPVNKVSFLGDVDIEEETDGGDPGSTSPITETSLSIPRPRGHRLVDAIL